MSENADSNDLTEYVATVSWVKTVERDDAKWKSNAKLYTTTHVRASLDGQERTIEYLNEEFGRPSRAYTMM